MVGKELEKMQRMRKEMRPSQQANGRNRKGTDIVTREGRGGGVLCLLWLITFVLIVSIETGLI